MATLYDVRKKAVQSIVSGVEFGKTARENVFAMAIIQKEVAPHFYIEKIRIQSISDSVLSVSLYFNEFIAIPLKMVKRGSRFELMFHPQYATRSKNEEGKEITTWKTLNLEGLQVFDETMKALLFEVCTTAVVAVQEAFLAKRDEARANEQAAPTEESPW